MSPPLMRSSSDKRQEGEVMVYQKSNGRFVVAEYDERGGQYLAPMNAREKRATGCHSVFARRLDDLAVHSYSTRSAARRWEKSLYGEEDF